MQTLSLNNFNLALQGNIYRERFGESGVDLNDALTAKEADFTQ